MNKERVIAFSILGVVCLLIAIGALMFSIFSVGQIAILSPEECRAVFLFTPQDVQYCSKIYPIDQFLLLFKIPSTYYCLTCSAVVVACIYALRKEIRKRVD